MSKKILVLGICLCMAFAGLTMTVSAGENTTYTYTMSVDQEWIRTQDAYMPGRVYLKDAGLTKPKDVFWFENKLYVADSGNGRIVILDLKSGAVNFAGEGILSQPSGIFVDDDGTLYVADPGLEAVVIFNSDRSEKMRITRPDSYLFNSQSVYKPKNVVVSSQGNIFVVGQGAYEGLMQFDRNGVFQGYFAANKRQLSVLETIQESLFTDEQKQQMLARIPRAIENLDLADRDMIYSVTQGENQIEGIGSDGKIQNFLKLHNMSGLNVLSRNNSMTEEWNFVDVAKGTCGNVYALTATGLIYEYNQSGNLLFSFGGRAVSSDRAGLFTVAAALDVDDQGIIYVLDEERGFIQTFFPTDFAAVTHKAINDLEQGNYQSSEEIWQSVLKLNGNSSIAHLGYGKSLLHQGKYKEAMQHFKICGNKYYYSQAFWEIRNRWLNKNITAIIIGVVVLCILNVFLKKRRKKRSELYDTNVPETEQRNLLKDLTYLRMMLTHPIDAYYNLKRGLKGSILSASILYILFFGVFVCDLLVRSYLFSTVNLNVIPVSSVPIMFFVPLFLWIFGNNMVSSINDGEGSFKSIYISTAYSFAPYIFLTPLAVLLTYALSLNESFLVSLLWTVALVWTAVLIIIGMMEIHNYTLGQSLKNLLLILFFMVMAVVTLAILYLIWTQVFGYLQDVFGEACYHLFGK